MPVVLRISVFLSIIGIFFTTSVAAQWPVHTSAIWDQTQYSIKNGVPIPQLSCSYIDRSGHIWTGGQGGLFRFDGYNYTSYGTNNGLSSSWIRCISGDSNNVIYIGTTAELAIIRNNTVISYQLQPGKLRGINAIFPVSSTELLVSSADEIWKLTIRKDSIISVKVLTVEQAVRAGIKSLCKDAAGRLYYSTANGFFVFQNNVQILIDSSIGKVGNGSQLLPDQQQAVWYANDRLNRITWPGGKLKIEHVDIFANTPAEKLTKHIPPTAMFMAGDELLLYGKEPASIFPGPSVVVDGYYFMSIYSIKTGLISHIKGVATMDAGFPVDILKDKEGNYWLTNAQVQTKLRKLDYIETTPEMKGLKDLQGIYQIDQQSAWIVTVENGLVKWLNGKMVPDEGWRLKYAQGGLDSTDINSMIIDRDGNEWIASFYNGIYRRQKNKGHYQVNKFALTKDSVPMKGYTRIFQASDGLIYAGGWYRADVYEGTGFQSLPSDSVMSLKGAVVADINEDVDGNILFATTKGLYSYKKGHWTNLSTTLGIEGCIVTSLCIGKDGTVWVGTYGKGILHLRKAGNQYTLKESITTDNGLTDNSVNVLDVDSKGRIWSSNFKGYNMILPEVDRQSRAIRITSKMLIEQYYSMNMGITCDNIGNVYAFTGNGLLRFNITSTAFSEKIAASIPLYITGFQVFNKDLDSSGQQSFPYFLNVPLRPLLNYDQNHVTIRFTGLYYTDPESVRYSYQLQGGSANEWTAFSDQRSVTYSKLPPGNYTFNVRANVNGNLSPITSYTFMILEPWWQTIWFKLAAFLAGLASVAAIFYYYYRSRIAKSNRMVAALKEAAERKQELMNMEQHINDNKLKALQAQMNPHFIFNVLSSIQHFIRTGNTNSSEKLLTDFGSLIRKSMDISGQSYITIRQELDYLEEYIKVEQQRTSHFFQYNIVWNSPEVNMESYYIPGMLLQPIIENAILHGLLAKNQRPALLAIRFRLLSEKQLECTIEDNGLGLVAPKQNGHKSMAIDNVKQRLFLYGQYAGHEINFDMQRISGSGDWATGTRVIIQIPCLAIADDAVTNSLPILIQER